MPETGTKTKYVFLYRVLLRPEGTLRERVSVTGIPGVFSVISASRSGTLSPPLSLWHNFRSKPTPAGRC